MNFIHRLDLKQAEIGQDEIARFLLRHWRENGGTKTVDVAKASPHYVLFSGTLVGDMAPSILMTGRSSLTTKVLKLQEMHLENVDDLIGSDYRRFVASSYKDTTQNQQPVLDLISADIVVGAETERIVYERLLLPYKTRTGIPHIICYSAMLEHHAKHQGPNRKAEISGSPQAISLSVPRSRPDMSSTLYRA